MIGVSSAVDPMTVGLQLGVAMNIDPRDKSIRDPRLTSGETTGVFVVAGQSNCANTVDTLYTPTNSDKVDNLNVFDGGLYAFVDPPVGCAGILGSWLGRLGDKLIAASVFERVIFCPIGVSATAIASWVPGGPLNQNLVVAAKRLAAVGLSVTAFLWQQGESNHGTSRASYAASLADVISTPRDEGFNAPWFLAKSTLIAGATDSNVRGAIDDTVNGTDIFAGADTDTLTGTTYRQASNDPHFTATGADAAAGLWTTALNAVF
jgi:hypothetical protein